MSVLGQALLADWRGPLRVMLTTVCAYAALVIILRLSGKRTLSKLNAFDLVETIALGSTLASVITSPDRPLAEGLCALLALVGLQAAVAFATTRLGWAERLVKAEPTLLVRDGAMLKDAARRARITEAGLEAAVRKAGGRRLEDASLVVLEADGSLTAQLKAGRGASA